MRVMENLEKRSIKIMIMKLRRQKIIYQSSGISVDQEIIWIHLVFQIWWRIQFCLIIPLSGDYLTYENQSFTKAHVLGKGKETTTVQLKTQSSYNTRYILTYRIVNVCRQRCWLAAYFKDENYDYSNIQSPFGCINAIYGVKLTNLLPGAHRCLL